MSQRVTSMYHQFVLLPGRLPAHSVLSLYLSACARAAGAGHEVQQHQGEEELHRYPGLSAEHHQRLLEDGLSGELPGHRHDNQRGGAWQGEPRR